MSSAATCPGCGLAVPAGYPRCPRCHAPLPGAPSGPGGGGRAEAGGTSLPDGRRPVLLMVAGAVAAVAAVVAVVILMRDRSGGGHAAAPAPAVGVDDGQEAPPAQRRRSNAVPDDPVVAQSGASTASLAIELEQRRLWANLDVEGDAVVIHTAYCTDPGLSQALEATSGDLIAAGITAVRCHERHGPLVFERPLVSRPPVSDDDAGP